jgi:hypothetical protein
MAHITYRCTQYGECDKADNREPITIQPGEEPICPNPECGKPLTRDTSNDGGPISLPPLKLIIAIVAVVVIGAAAYFFWPHRTSPAPTASVEDSLADVWPWLKAPK